MVPAEILLNLNLVISKGLGLLVMINKLYSAGIAIHLKMNSDGKI